MDNEAVMSTYEIDLMLFGPRKCNGCGHTFPASSEYFHRDKHQGDGLRTLCRRCISERGAERYRKRKEAGR